MAQIQITEAINAVVKEHRQDFLNDFLAQTIASLENQGFSFDESLSTAVNSPRSLTVQTPNPVDDAAKILSAMQKGQVAAAGL